MGDGKTTRVDLVELCSSVSQLLDQAFWGLALVPAALLDATSGALRYVKNKRDARAKSQSST